MKSKIVSIGTAVPSYSTEQSRTFDFMKKAYDDELASRKLEALFRFSGIKKRHSVLPDFGNLSPPEFFKHQQQQPDVHDRMKKFQSHALDLALKAIFQTLVNSQEKPDDITHLITVTCTGLLSPGLNAEIMERLSLKNDIFNTSVNFLGCGAAFHALKMADYIVRSDEKAKVLIVCVELCTLHFQPKPNIDNLLSNTIFNDGAAGALVTSGKNNKKGLTVNGFYSLLMTDGHHLMGWYINPTGFEMILNSGVPDFIGREIKNAVEKATGFYKINPSDIQHWAIHPGGKKILDKIGQVLGMNNNELGGSYEVLRDYGNMSSPTILFVLKNMLENGIKENENIFAIGFGPGLSVETASMTYA